MGKKLEIVFRPKDVDTEKVREAIEDTMGVEILEINEFAQNADVGFVKIGKGETRKSLEEIEKLKTPCDFLDDMIRDEHDAPSAYEKLRNKLDDSELLYPPRENDLMKIIMNEHISDERKHHEALVELKAMVC